MVLPWGNHPCPFHHSVKREGLCDGIPACGHGQRAQGPTDLTPQSSGPFLCSQVGSGYQGWGRGRAGDNRAETLRLGFLSPPSPVFPAHTGTGDRRLQKQIQEGLLGETSQGFVESHAWSPARSCSCQSDEAAQPSGKACAHSRVHGSCASHVIAKRWRNGV